MPLNQASLPGVPPRCSQADMAPSSAAADREARRALQDAANRNQAAMRAMAAGDLIGAEAALLQGGSPATPEDLRKRFEGQGKRTAPTP